MMGSKNLVKENREKSYIIPCSLIDENIDNEFIFNMDEDSVVRLAKAIEEDGFLGAIDVLSKPDGRYEIISGHRRFRATQLAGNTEIPCFIYNSLDPEEKLKRFIRSNINNREMTAMDKARAIDYYMTKVISTKTQKEAFSKAEDFFGLKSSSIKNYLSILKLIPEIQDLITKNLIPYAGVTNLATLSREDQLTLHKIFMNELSRIDMDPLSKRMTISIVKSFLASKNIQKQADLRKINDNEDAPVAVEHRESYPLQASSREQYIPPAYESIDLEKAASFERAVEASNKAATATDQIRYNAEEDKDVSNTETRKTLEDLLFHMDSIYSIIKEERLSKREIDVIEANLDRIKSIIHES